MRDTDWIAYGGMLLSGRVPMSNYEHIRGVAAAFFRSKTKAELFEIARANNFLIAPVATINDVLENPQFIAREYWQKMEGPGGVALRYPGPFARFGATPITFRRRPPAAGEHNREILIGELGLSESEFADAARKGII
jgi:crotonobetainyl-CoA:carnitine CoA-transferase CaiB-like acyl-CoA transferase